jgi:NADPH-dependent 2,4-dienoyl-CoA reductase/sulfur reductase-like enzyme
MSETRNIVFLGASYAGISATHYFLKHVYPHLPASSTIKYKVILINASPKWYQRHASPRAIANTLLMPNEKIFLDIEPGFKQYGDKVKFVVGKATSWSPEKRVLFITEPSGRDISISYHALVLATGSKSHSAVWSSFGNGHEEIEAALADVNAQVKVAKSIVIAGGGPAGVETAGEIADYLNGTPGWFQKRPKNPKAHIMLITSSDKLLPRLRPAIAKQAEHDLNRLGVEVQYNAKVRLHAVHYFNPELTKTQITSASPSINDSAQSQTKLTLSNGSSLYTDLYLPALGSTPLSSYIPTHLLDSHARILTTESTLRVTPAAGPLVYALGDITSFTTGGIPEIQAEVPVLASNMKRDLLAAHAGDLSAKPKGVDRVYEPERRELQLVPLGRGGGVGAIYGWRVPSWAVWLIKGRDYLVGRSSGRLFGETEVREVKWEAEGLTA